MVQIRKRHTPVVELIDNDRQPVKDLVVQTVSGVRPQRHRVHPTSGEGKRSDPAQEPGHRCDPGNRLECGGLTPDKPPPEGVAGEKSARFIGLDRDPEVIHLVELDVSLGPVPSFDSPNRLDPCQDRAVKHGSRVSV